MDLVIKIDKIDYEAIRHGKPISAKVMNALIHGTPLPKVHNKLYDLDDLISRQLVINVFGDDIHPLDYLTNGYLEAVKELPSANQWIPVTERLPDIGIEVLFCDIDGNEYIGHITSFKKWSANGYDDYIKSVVAWMPRLKPYDGGES